MRGPRAALACSALALGLLAATPSPVSACISDEPTFEEAVRGARAIARVVIVDGFDNYSDDPTTSETFRVARMLKGKLPEFVTLAPAWTTLCHDSVGWNAGAEESDGRTILLAIDMPYYGQTIHPMWTTGGSHGVWGSAGVPAGVTTLAELEAAVLAQLGLPDTATLDAEPAAAPPFAVIFVAGLVTLVVTARRSRIRVRER